MSAAELVGIQQLALDDPVAANEDGDLLQRPQDLRLRRRRRRLLRQQLQDLGEFHDFGVGEKGEKSVVSSQVFQLEEREHVRGHGRSDLEGEES